jgi:hypothetical protein
MKIGAGTASHGRDALFQLAEVAAPRALFAGICVGPMTCGYRNRRSQHDGSDERRQTRG